MAGKQRAKAYLSVIGKVQRNEIEAVLLTQVLSQKTY